MPILRVLLLTFILLPAGSLALSNPQTLSTKQVGYNQLIAWQVFEQLPVDTTNQDLQAVLKSKPISDKNKLTRRQFLAQEPIKTQRAWLYSAVLPGLGQWYNQRYWKIYMIYGVLAGLTWGSIYNHQEYKESKRELIKSQQFTSLGNYVQSRKRDRNLFIILASLWYVINIFDAYVDGTIKTFDVSDNFEVSIRPSINPTTCNDATAGLGMTLSLKK